MQDKNIKQVMGDSSNIDNNQISSKTRDLNEKLEIRNLKGLEFRISNNVIVEFDKKAWGFYIKDLGWLKFKHDKEPVPYVPLGGKKALESILADKGFLDYSDIEFLKPIEKKMSNSDISSKSKLLEDYADIVHTENTNNNKTETMADERTSQKSSEGSYNIPTLDESLYRDYAKGKISLHDAAAEFAKGGWTNFIDLDYTRNQFAKFIPSFRMSFGTWPGPDFSDAYDIHVDLGHKIRGFNFLDDMKSLAEKNGGTVHEVGDNLWADFSSKFFAEKFIREAKAELSIDKEDSLTVHNINNQNSKVMAEQNSSPKTAAQRQAEILIAALEKAGQNNGVLVNDTMKQAPRFYDKNLRINPVNALVMAMHSDAGDYKTNSYVTFNDLKSRAEAVRRGEKAVPFIWTNNNEFVNKDNPDDKISRKEYNQLPEADKDHYKVNPKEDYYNLFNIDQTTMPHVHKDEYEKHVAEYGGHASKEDTFLSRDDKALRANVNDFIQKMKENLVSTKKVSSSEALYDSNRDAVMIPAQKNFPSYNDYVQEVTRQFVQATGVDGRLNRFNDDWQAAQVDDKKDTDLASKFVDKIFITQAKESLVQDLSSAVKMIDFGLPAKLHPETMRVLPELIEKMKNDPKFAEAVMHDVNRTVGMINKAESGQKIQVYDHDVKQQKDVQISEDIANQTYKTVAILKDDEGKWTLAAKPENGKSFAIHPSKEDLSHYFGLPVSERLQDLKTQLAQKYQAELAVHPEKSVNLFKTTATPEALALVSDVRIFKGKDSKMLMLANIDGEKQKVVPVSPQQWQRLWLADDLKEAKTNLAANLYADVLSAKLNRSDAQVQVDRFNNQLDTLYMKAHAIPYMEVKDGHPYYPGNLNMSEHPFDRIEKLPDNLEINGYLTLSKSEYRYADSAENAEWYTAYSSLKDLPSGLKYKGEIEGELPKTAEQKDKELQEEKAKEDLTKEETKVIATVALSPVMKSFTSMKEKQPDTLLLFQIGDRYEAYQQDAHKISDTFGIETSKSKNEMGADGKPVEIASFSNNMLDKVLDSLVKTGQRVAILEPQEKEQSVSVAEKEKPQEEVKIVQSQEQASGMHR